MASAVIKITSNDDLVNLIRVDTLAPQETAERISAFMDRCALGAGMGTSFDMQINGGDGVKASGTFTLASVVATNDCVVAGETFTASATPSGDNEFLVGANNTATAANLAAKIAAHPNLSPFLSATSALAVVTVQCSEVGLIGNNIAITGGTHITASGSALASGAEPTAKVCHLGL